MWVLVRVSWIGCGLLAFSLGNFFGLGGGGGGVRGGVRIT
jgi:hypothetical protein